MAPGAMAAATLGKAGEEEAVAADGEVPLLPSRCIQNGDDERPISVAMVLRTTEASLPPPLLLPLLLPLLQVTAEPHWKEIGLAGISIFCHASRYQTWLRKFHF